MFVITNILPSVFSPVGTFIGLPVRRTSIPRFNPSVTPNAMAFTSLSPFKNYTSIVRIFPSVVLTSKASKNKVKITSKYITTSS